jgi:hypothetical protein
MLALSLSFATQLSSCFPVQPWVVGVIVGSILLLLPVPLFFLIRWRKRKNKEARDLQVRSCTAMKRTVMKRTDKLSHVVSYIISGCLNDFKANKSQQ